MMDQKHLENAEYFKYLDNLITDDARCKREIKCRIAIGEGSIQQEERKKLVDCYIWNGALYGAGNWTHRKVDQK
jgi:hypothetical protein